MPTESQVLTAGMHRTLLKSRLTKPITVLYIRYRACALQCLCGLGSGGVSILYSSGDRRCFRFTKHFSFMQDLHAHPLHVFRLVFHCLTSLPLAGAVFPPSLRHTVGRQPRIFRALLAQCPGRFSESSYFSWRTCCTNCSKGRLPGQA